MSGPAFKVDNFISAIKTNGLARPYLFKLSIPGFSKEFELIQLSNISKNTNWDKLIELYVKSVSFPSKSIKEISYNFQGRELLLPGEMEFGELSFTVINDEDMGIRQLFENWMNFIVNYKTAFRSADTSSKNNPEYLKFSNLFKDIFLTSILPDGSEGPKIKFCRSFPTQVSDMGFSWITISDTLDFNVNMAYQYYEFDRPLMPSVNSNITFINN